MIESKHGDCLVNESCRVSWPDEKSTTITLVSCYAVAFPYLAINFLIPDMALDL